ncbi:MAG: RNA-binding domain-containing protein, partial [Nanoarchaeota archaeon]
MMKFIESEKVELKPSLSQIDEVVETVAAFANTSGGKILIGVSDKGEVIGAAVGKDTLERLTNKLRQNTDPAVYPHLKLLNLGGKTVIEITVPESKDKPVLAFGRVFKRVGKSTLKASRSEYECMMLEKRKVFFDSFICGGAKLSEIDGNKVKEFLFKAGSERRLNIGPETSVKEALERLGLLMKGKLTNAAILLFGRNPQKYLLHSEARCARFKGTEPVEFIDMKVFGGTLLEMRDNAVEFVKEHIKMGAKVVGTERIETWEYPLEAVREAITNAICHRDYEQPSMVQVRIFDDRVEIWGCGKLPLPLKLEDLKRKHDSV